MSQTAQPDFVNADVDDILEEQQEQRAEEKQEHAQQESLLRKIEQRRADKTVHIRVEGAKVPCEPPGGVVDEVQDMAGEFAGVDEDEMTNEEYTRYQEMRNRVDEILGEKSKDEGMTAAWWKQTFAPEERQRYLGQLARGGVEAKNADGFREE